MSQIQVKPATLAMLSQVSTATITTQLFKCGLRNTFLFGLSPLNKESCRFVGEAFTLRYIPAREDLDVPSAFENPDHPQRKAIESLEPHHVLIMDCRNEPRAASAGSILVTRMRERGALGLVTDGSVRDSPPISKMDFPVFTAGVSASMNLSMHHAVDIQTPIACAGVPVFPGDILVGDEEGVVVIPRELTERIAEPALEQERLEEYIEARVSEGAALPGTYPPNEETLRGYRAWKDS